MKKREIFMLKIFIKENTENVININDVYFNKYNFKKLEYETSKKIIKEAGNVGLDEQTYTWDNKEIER